MKPAIIIKRQLGDKVDCVGAKHCPTVFEDENGDFLIMGSDVTVDAEAALPPTSGRGANEAIVKLPRNVMIAAIRDLASS